MNVTELLAESWRAFRSSPVAAFLILLLTAGMSAIAVASAGSHAATYSQIASSLTSPEARVFKVTESNQQALTTTLITSVRSLSSVERALGMTTPEDVVAGNLGQGSIPVPLTRIYGDISSAVRLTSGRLPTHGESIVGLRAKDKLRLVDGIGYVESGVGQQWPIVGTFEAISPFGDLNDYVIVTDEVPAYARLHVLAPNLATLPNMESAVSRVIGEHPGLDITKNSAAASAADSLKLMSILRSSGTAQIAQTIGGGLLVIFGVVFADVLLHARDLGRRRTLGITRTNLVAFIELRVAYSAIIGAVLGAICAHLVLALQAVAVPARFTAATIVLTIAAAVLAALIPGVIAAYRDPVTVMRTHV
ncbi:hypothetical protein INS90_02800 [Trueperella pecoris]|uniref:FtsX-like permease family protein n=1 Tax=Trueperella pecoris TaxID=2733571 RepID=A0A7M1R3G9_9ACTO|nr:hypothetical protein [Trueperella pecoris]QOR48234.1 hypothetical protein INS90_02800 [Trueperella pecoris]